MKRIAIYTAVFGNYDDLSAPVHADALKSEADFFCFTDDTTLTSDVFVIKNVQRPHSDPVKCNRFYKVLSHRFFSEYDITLYIDANVTLVCDSVQLIINKYLQENDIAVFPHPTRNCLYEEAAWVMSNPHIDRADVVSGQMARYRSEGFPQQHGLIAGTYLLRRHSAAVREFNELWWKEVLEGSRRDQLSFDYIRWKTGIQITILPGSWEKNFLGIRRAHKMPAKPAGSPTILAGIRKSKLYRKIITRFKAMTGINAVKLSPEHQEKRKELNRLKHIPNNVQFETSLFGKTVRGNHRGSFMFIYRELFEQGVYDFNADSETPFIIDCGVNVGLSVIYFKQRYPGAHVIGFEPDDELFALARNNIASMGYTNVDLKKKGVWKEEGSIKFYAEGTDSGRIATSMDLSSLKEIQTVRLSDYIDRTVDFLKMDIEGAETAVIQECEEKLHLVKHLFIEYHSFVNEPQDLGIIINILEKNGFRYSISSPKVLNPKPFITRSNYMGMDFLLNIHAYRK